MPPPTTRVEVLFSPEQFSRLQAIAQSQGESVDTLIRKAVEEVYLRHEQEERLEAVRRMAALSLPIADWEQTERDSAREYSLE